MSKACASEPAVTEGASDHWTTISRFLTDVMTAAGLVEHGKQCKALAERMSADAAALRTALYNNTHPAPAAAVPAVTTKMCEGCGIFPDGRVAPCCEDCPQHDHPAAVPESPAALTMLVSEWTRKGVMASGTDRYLQGFRDSCLVAARELSTALRTQAPAATEAPSDELTADQIDAIDEHGPLIEGWRVVFENGRNGPGCYAYFKDIHNGDDCYFLGATPAPAVGASYHCVGYIEHYGTEIRDLPKGKQCIPVYVLASPTPTNPSNTK